MTSERHGRLNSRVERRLPFAVQQAPRITSKDVKGDRTPLENDAEMERQKEHMVQKTLPYPEAFPRAWEEGVAWLWFVPEKKG